MLFENSVAAITGGASGLGAATARRFCAAGAAVALLDRDAERGARVAAELGERAVFCETDVTDPDAVQAAIDAACQLGTLRIAVNCAGIGWASRTINRKGEAHDLSMFQKVVSVNLVGTFNVLRLAAAAIARSEPAESGARGVIINTASVAAFDGQIGQIAYSASKAGVAGMTLPAARDLSAVGIRVNTIAPGLFDTPMLAMLPEPVREALGASVVFPKRLGNVDEYAQLAQSIVENPYLNGETIRLDGSLRMAPK